LIIEAMKNCIEEFYSAFAVQDGERMANCYHNDVVFEDPAFGKLKGQRASAMWKMLCESQKGKGFELVYSDVKISNEKGSANWEAKYVFSKTGRKVHNKISAKFELKEGKIIKHIDSFDLYQWSIRAFGLKGRLMGWTGFFKNKLQAQTNVMLDKYMKRQQEAIE